MKKRKKNHSKIFEIAESIIKFVKLYLINFPK